MSTRTATASTQASGLYRPLDRFQIGAELETADYRPPTFPPLFGVAKRLGITVRYAPHVDKFRGYYAPGQDRIVLCSHDVDVFFHELGHAAHRQVLQARGTDLKNGQVASQEIVAETVAATLCQLYGFGGYVYHSASYLTHYANGTNPGRAAMRVLADVQATLNVILDDDGAREETPAAAPRELVAA